MNLISCDNCAVVLDANKLVFPKDMENEDGSIDERKALYNQYSKEFEIYTACPVCEQPVFKP